MSDDAAEPRIIHCGTHGPQGVAVVCRHHIEARDRALGFVENSDDPDDLQAWCDECETFFLAEGDMTEEFRKFNDFAVVCIECYSILKARHSSTDQLTASRP